MAERVVADAGSLIVLARINYLHLLPSVLGAVCVSPAVLDECLRIPGRADAKRIQCALEQRQLERKAPLRSASARLSHSLGTGEREAITLALELGCPALIDDKIARHAAYRHSTKVIGTAGVLVTAKRAGLITAVYPLLRTMSESGYYLSADLVARILELSNESSNESRASR